MGGQQHYAAWRPLVEMVALFQFLQVKSLLLYIACYTTQVPMSIVRIPSSDQQLPPAAVIVTIRSGTSFDELYTQRTQISPDPSHCIAVYSTDYETLPAILSALQQPGSQAGGSASLRSLIADIIAVSAESPSCVVFNFECCSGAGSHGFAPAHCSPCDNPCGGNIMHTVAYALDRGFMVIFGDWSLKALIKDWDHSLLGPLPFEDVGATSGTIRLRFNREHLIQCPSSQLQCVGQLCSDNFAGVHALGNTIKFVVKAERPETDAYHVQVLTVAEIDTPSSYVGPIMTLGQYNGTAGHVLLTYRSGGMMLVSATHWIELTNVNADEAEVAQVLMLRQGQLAAEQFQQELQNCMSAEERKVCSAQKAVALVQYTTPCRTQPRTAPF